MHKSHQALNNPIKPVQKLPFTIINYKLLKLKDI
jgi:hypothetical protein